MTDTPSGLRLADDADHSLLNDTIVKLTVAMRQAVPGGSVDPGTLAHALVEMAAFHVATCFPHVEHGMVIEHLQNFLAQAVHNWDEEQAKLLEVLRGK